jgi:hypothetical protein
METTDKQYTLIYYRPNGSKYRGCGDYDNFDSEIGCDQSLSFAQLQHRITEVLKRADCCDSCSDNDNPTEFAIFCNGKPIFARGDAMWGFAPEDDLSEETHAIEEMLHENHIRSEKEKREAVEAKRKEDEAKALAAKLRAQEQTDARDRAEFDRLKTKFEARP